jgi:hypothetical protein
MESSEKIDLLAVALVKAQGEFPSVPMDADNPYFKSKYATLGSMIQTVKPILLKNGLAIIQMVCGGVVMNTTQESVGVRTMLVHESGQYIMDSATINIDAGQGKNPAQVAGGYISYLRRYAYGAILGLYAEEDNDGNTPEQKKEQVTPVFVKVVKQMTLEQAGAELDSEGKPYSQIDQEALDKKLFGIEKKLKMPDLPAAEREKYQNKYDAIMALRRLRGQKKEL